MVTPVFAQEYTTGAFAGRVTDVDGAPIAGAAVTLESEAQGFTRNATTSEIGGFRFPGLPPGFYRVSVEATVGSISQSNLQVRASSTSDYTFVVGPPSGTDTIVVTGVRRNQDFGNTTTGINLDVSDLTASIPVGRSVTDLILFAPTAVVGDSTFGNVSSLGGSSVAENAYYLNGLNITNFDNYLGSAPVPFEFLQSVEVKTGGYPAEFGRATGGVINAVTKSGTNEWRGALHLNWEPDGLSSSAPDTYLERNGLDENSAANTIVELGGPIIPNRLFVYGLAEFQDVRRTNAGIASGSYDIDEENDPIWAAKVDAYPLEDHHLEFTYFNTETERQRTTYEFDSATDEIGAETGRTLFKLGGENYIGKYTGAFTDWLTLSGAYGVSRDRFEVLPGNTGNLVTVQSTGEILSSQTEDSVITPYETEREFYRFDADIYFNLFGEHHIRTGFDRENNTLSKVSVLTGADNIDGGGVALVPGGVNYELLECGVSTPQCVGAGLAPGDTYVAVNYGYSGGFFDGENTAYYLQDEWAVTPQLTMNLGVRLDQFANFGADGVQWIDFDSEWAPRVGLSYDVFDDGGTKVFGSYGRYFLPVATNTSFSFFGSGFSFSEFWETDGAFGAGGVPTLTDQITGFNGGANCPFAIFGAVGQNCRVIGDGSVPTSETFISRNLQASEEEEFIAGITHQLNDLWTVGLTYTHRSLLSTAEDSSLDAGIRAYCANEGISGCDAIWDGFHQYVLINPGEDVTITLNELINGETEPRTVTLLAEDLGFPEVERLYDAVEFTFAREFDGTWSLQGSYTWSDSRGNSEGFVQSDFSQAIPGITADFDLPGFSEGAYGKLPNHREHQFKVWGSYQVTENFLVGVNAVLASPRQLSCIGNHKGDFDGTNFEYWYGSWSHYCQGRLQPRGTGFDGAGLESDWYKNVDLSLRYDVELYSGVDMTLRADVFNIINFDSIVDRDEYGEADYSTQFRSQYGLPTSYQQPRYVRLGVDVEF